MSIIVDEAEAGNRYLAAGLIFEPRTFSLTTLSFARSMPDLANSCKIYKMAAVATSPMKGKLEKYLVQL